MRFSTARFFHVQVTSSLRPTFYCDFKYGEPAKLKSRTWAFRKWNRKSVQDHRNFSCSFDSHKLTVNRSSSWQLFVVSQAKIYLSFASVRGLALILDETTSFEKVSYLLLPPTIDSLREILIVDGAATFTTILPPLACLHILMLLVPLHLT